MHRFLLYFANASPKTGTQPQALAEMHTTDHCVMEAALVVASASREADAPAATDGAATGAPEQEQADVGVIKQALRLHQLQQAILTHQLEEPQTVRH